MAVDTSLVEIDEEPSQLKGNSDSSKESLALLDKNISTPDESIPVEKANKSVVSKNEPLLPIDDELNLEDSHIDLREKTEFQQKGISDKDLDTGKTMGENLNPVDESSLLLQEDTISLDGSLGRVEESLGLEENQSSTEDGNSPSWELVEEPDLSPEVFETLWKQLPET